jgi:diguanylate cyclase (GGDEF)-like protein
MDERYRILFRKLKEMADLDEGRRDLGGILARAASVTQEALGAHLAYAAAPSPSGDLIAGAETGSPSRVEPWGSPGRLGQHVLQSKEVRLWKSGENPTPNPVDMLGREGMGSWMGGPLLVAGQPAGLIAVARRGGEGFTTEERDLLSVVSEQTTVAIGNLRTFLEIESLSVTDDLTRIYNYRFMKAALRREVDRASRYGQVFSILMLDVDHLKKFNEVHGHLQGSDLLRRLAAILSRSSRAIDLVAKYGGDEFLLILPQTNTDGATVMGKRICQAVAESAFPHCRPGDITISVGVASFPQHGSTMETLLAASDEALFTAKRSGRNCVIAAERPGQPGRIPKVA